jgi:hypothetical protein
MDTITMFNNKETEKLMTDLRHRYILLCEMHLTYEKRMNKALNDGDDNMAAYWQLQADREWKRATAVATVLDDMRNDCGY